MSEELKPRREKGKIWSHIRKKWLDETPEETVRQEFLCVLVNEYGFDLVQMDEEAAGLAREIASLTEMIDKDAGAVDSLQSEVSEGQQRGYTLDAGAKEQGRLASEAAVELERARNRQASNAERIAELTVAHLDRALEGSVV